MGDNELVVQPNELLPPAQREENFALGRLQPQNFKELAWYANELAKTGSYLKTVDRNQVPMNGHDLFMVMTYGIEMGITPHMALDNIYLMVDKHGRTSKIPRADLLSAKINSDPRTEEWSVDESTPGTVTITAKRRGRDRVTISMSLSDIPQRDKDRWAKTFQDPQEMLINRTIRRIAKRYFRDMILGMGGDDSFDERRVVDVAVVERHVGAGEAAGPCEKCGAPAYLVASNNGGVFASCSKCGNTQSPPQKVRDAIRGRTDEFKGAVVDALPAGTVEPGLEYVREPTPEESAELGAESEPNPKDAHGYPLSRHEMCESTILALKANMVDDKPSEAHQSLLNNYGWEPTMKVSRWLESLTDETLFNLCTDVDAARREVAPA